jgi:hypothetical protein
LNAAPFPISVAWTGHTATSASTATAVVINRLIEIIATSFNVRSVATIAAED